MSRSAPCPAWLQLRHRCELPASHGGHHRSGVLTWARTPAEQRLFERTVLGHLPTAPTGPVAPTAPTAAEAPGPASR